MHLLDTDTLTHLHAGHPRVVKKLRNLEDPLIGTTIISKLELLRGRFDFLMKAADGPQLLRAQHWLNRTEELLEAWWIVPFDQAAANELDTLRVQSGLRKLGRADLLIASIALANRATLVTRNLKHFSRIPRLRVVNWVDG